MNRIRGTNYIPDARNKNHKETWEYFVPHLPRSNKRILTVTCTKNQREVLIREVIKKQGLLLERTYTLDISYTSNGVELSLRYYTAFIGEKQTTSFVLENELLNQVAAIAVHFVRNKLLVHNVLFAHDHS